MSLVELKKLKLVELKKMCEDLKLPTNGAKADLINRLKSNEEKVIVTLQPNDEAELLDDVSDANEADFLDVSATDDLSINTTVESTPLPRVTVGQKRISFDDDEVTESSLPSKRAKPDNENEPESKEVIVQPTLTNKEKIARRAQRFGEMITVKGQRSNTGPLKEGNLIDRARRFGLPIQIDAEATSASSDIDKMKIRADRFGDSLDSKLTTATLTDLEQKAKRIAKFGGQPVSIGGDQAEEKRRKELRAVRFGSGTTTTPSALISTAVDLEKLNQRAVRFGLVPSTKTATANVVE